MSNPPLTDTRGAVISRIRMPFVAVALGALFVPFFLDVPQWWWLPATMLFVLAMLLYVRVGIPHGEAVDLAPPVRGRWLALNSPSTRVPSHRLNAWSQTYAIDLVADPAGGARPRFAWWPIARRPEDFPGFAQPILAPIDGVVVRRHDAMRDHWSRSSPISLAYFAIESVRELLGPIGVLGNHVVIRHDDGVHVLLAHLRHRSVLVARGDRVETGDIIAQCGNSGNSTEPHVHVQAMDGPSTWTAAGLPILMQGTEPPGDGEHLVLGHHLDLDLTGRSGRTGADHSGEIE